MVIPQQRQDWCCWRQCFCSHKCVCVRVCVCVYVWQGLVVLVPVLVRAPGSFLAGGAAAIWHRRPVMKTTTRVQAAKVPSEVSSGLAWVLGWARVGRGVKGVEQWEAAFRRCR